MTEPTKAANMLFFSLYGNVPTASSCPLSKERHAAMVRAFVSFAERIDQWRPIEEAPTNGEMILVFGGPYKEPTLATKSDVRWWRDVKRRGTFVEILPTHWHLLPAPPFDIPKPETFTEEIARLNREIGDRVTRLQNLICGDPRKSVHVPAKPER